MNHSLEFHHLAQNLETTFLEHSNKWYRKVLLNPFRLWHTLGFYPYKDPKVGTIHFKQHNEQHERRYTVQQVVTINQIKIYLKRGSITRILTFCDENGATTPSVGYKIILEHREKEINWSLERNYWWPALVHYGDENARTWKQLV